MPDPATQNLLRRRYLGLAEPAEYVDWAIGQICADKGGANLILLAGLYLRLEADQVEPYFLAACAELNVVPLGELDWHAAAQLIREAHTAGFIRARAFVSEMAELYVLSEYSAEEFSTWSDIEEELCMDGSDYSGLYYDPLLLRDLDRLVEREWQLYLAGRRFGTPPRWSYFCRRCASLSAYNPGKVPLWQRLFGRKHGKPAPHACPQCGSREHHRTPFHPEAREAYYSRLQADLRGSGTGDR